ncbi:hypothetical protein QJS04_geneDACA000738 [Acorus gramineus]|uniref:Uncharacterized protein n=1 Tax=Acorus gramineus TaxID=55184 RepID=A0AAV9BG76_ACOGR|nr:hypothetical protein QJS04_geneDACA016797 [Acorus gramineus]KAK1275822.1 hypothetical protein QJS04_geneDACA000738 [Acorus gramineus]
MTQQRGDPSNPPIAVHQYGTFPSAPPFQQQNIPQNPYCPHHAIPVGYQSYPTVVVEGVPLREPPLPLCGIGIGWALRLKGQLVTSADGPGVTVNKFRCWVKGGEGMDLLPLSLWKEFTTNLPQL